MSDLHFVAVHTYGHERYQDKPCLKVAPGPMTDALLAVFGSRAHEISSARTHYRYIHLTLKGVRTTHHFVVLALTDAEKANVESVCRAANRVYDTRIYLWERERKLWLRFPCSDTDMYHEVTDHSGFAPRFSPLTANWITPSKYTEKREPVPVTGTGQITLTQSGDWWWIGGDTRPHREILSAAGARWSAKRQAWYYKRYGRDLPESIRTLAAVAPQPVDSAATPPSTPVESLPAAPVVPVIQPPAVDPPAKPDPVQLAVEQVKTLPVVPTMPRVSVTPGTTASIAQSYVGELTGSITGNVQCYGYAIDMGICVYLNFGGPRLAVEAIRARLSKGEIVSCIPWDGASVELTAGEGNTGMYIAYMQNIPEARYTSVILLHRRVVEPLYGSKSRTCLIRTDPAQGVARLADHVRKLVVVPVFDTWASFLWEAGTLAKLLGQPMRAGGIDLWAVDLDADAWTRLICTGLKEGVIRLPDIAA